MTRAARMLVPLVLVAAGTAALWLRFNAPPGQVGAEFPFDLVFYYLPMMEQAAESLRAGRIPLWNPHNGCGVPLLATAQAGVFYPGNWPAVFLPVERVIPARMFVECLLGGLFTAGFLQSLGLRPPACGVGGVLFVFACMIGQTLWPPQVATIAWMPLAFWSVERFVQTGRRSWARRLAAVLVMQILAGYPQYLLYTLYLLVPYTAMRLVEVAGGGRRSESGTCSRPLPLAGSDSGCDGAGGPPAAAAPPSALRMGASLLLAGLTAVLLTALQWLPTLELTRQTVRQEPLRPGEVHYLETERGVEPSLARLLANAVNPGPKFTALDHPDGAGYLGLLAAPLIAVAIVSGRRRALVGFLLIAAVLFLLLSLGHFGPVPWLYRIYAALPTGGMFRTPGRLRLPAFFCLITLAAMGLDRLCRGTASLNRPRRAAWLIGLTLPAAMVADVVRATGRYGSLRDIPSAWARCFHVNGRRTVDAPHFNALAQRAGNDRVAMVGMLPPKPMRPLERPLFIGDYEPLMPQRWVEASAALGGRHGRTMLDVDPDRHPLIYDLASVRHLCTAVTDEAVRPAQPTWADCFATIAPRPPAEGVTVRETINQDALPRAYLVFHHEVCSPQQALERIVRGDLDARSTVLLEEHPPAARPSGQLAAADGDVGEVDVGEVEVGEVDVGEVDVGEVELVEYRPHRVVLRVRTPRDGLLVLTDSWYPGWEALDNARPVPILRANYLFRAVSLPAGRHEIVFRYRPRTWHAGWMVTALTASALGGLELSRHRRRSEGRTPGRKDAAAPA